MRFKPNRWVAVRVVIGLMLLTAGLATASCGSSVPDRDPAPETSLQLPDGYELRLDRPNRNPVEFVATSDGEVLRVHTGPAGIIYRPDQVASSTTYTARARFTEIDAPRGHREGFGLFIGGQDLEDGRQRYTYFLIRGDGRYLIKHRDGPSALEVSDGWELSAAVHIRSSEARDVANELAITVERDRVRFSCNGELVADIPIGGLSIQGVVGVRVNHNLEVNIEDLQVEQI